MHPKKQITPALQALIKAQDGLVTVEQLYAHGFDKHNIYKRTKARVWQRLLETVILTVSGTPTRRQQVVAAWLYAGPEAAVDGADACAWYGVISSRPATTNVHIVVPGDSPIRSEGFVTIRRATAEIQIGDHGLVPYVDVATALIVAARNQRNLPAAIDLLSRGLQRGKVDEQQLADARERIGAKWCAPVDVALAAVGVGIRSPAENDMRDLILTSKVLPEPIWNQWLDLGDGDPELCADALFLDAGLVNEVIGKKYHAWGEAYDDTNARKERVHASGLIMCEATPRRIRQSGGIVLANLERTHGRYAGRGMPPGVRLVPPPEWLRNRGQVAV